MRSEGATSPTRRSLRRLARDKLAMVALAWIVLMTFVAVLGSIWTPFDPAKQFVAEPFSGPGSPTWLGTDDLGRDVLSRLMSGAAVSLRVSVTAVIGALVIALPVGLIAGYRGSFTDTAIMRVLDAVTSIPGIISALAVIGVLGPGVGNLIIALVIVLTPTFVRLIRAQALAVGAEPYITASRSVGSRTSWILGVRVLPGVVPALTVQASLAFGAAFTAEAALSFLGLGVQPPDASWGEVLNRSYRNILRAPGGVLPPVIAIAALVLAFNMFGDGLRDALGTGVDHRARRRAKLGLTSNERAGRVSSTDVATTVAEDQPRLVVEGLCVEFRTEHGRVQALDRVSLSIGAGEVLGLVGESGSGKTVTAMSIMRLLPSPPGLITAGSIRYEGRELLDLSLSEMRQVRGKEISMIFQNPMTSLDPVFTVGSSLREAIRHGEGLSGSTADRRAVELLDMVGIPSPGKRLGDYPRAFSGGMRQRVMIAMALAGRPRLLIADEPTTALDVTIQAQILELLRTLGDELGMSMIFVTHDLGVVAGICDRVAVMYAGHVVETAPLDRLFRQPQHPYTAGLLEAVPSTTMTSRRLRSLPGIVPQLDAMPAGCRFAPRCSFAIDACRARVPEMVGAEEHHAARCIRARELDLVSK